MNRLQQEAQRLRAKEIHINDLLQPYQEQITELVDAVEQNVKEFTRRKSEIDDTKESNITKSMLETTQECVEVMQKEVTGFCDKLQRASQESKAKLQQEKPAGNGSRVSHK